MLGVYALRRWGIGRAARWLVLLCAIVPAVLLATPRWSLMRGGFVGDLLGDVVTRWFLAGAAGTVWLVSVALTITLLERIGRGQRQVFDSGTKVKRTMPLAALMAAVYFGAINGIRVLNVDWQAPSVIGYFAAFAVCAGGLAVILTAVMWKICESHGGLSGRIDLVVSAAVDMSLLGWEAILLFSSWGERIGEFFYAHPFGPATWYAQGLKLLATGQPHGTCLIALTLWALALTAAAYLSVRWFATRGASSAA